MHDKKIIGITGGFGTGKTTVAFMFQKRGAYIINADRLAHRFIRPGSVVYRKIISIFGKKYLKKDKTINKAKLAKLVFADRKKLKVLNNIVHPLVIKEIERLIKISHKEIVVIDAPLLIEVNLIALIDKLVVVKASRRTQITRCLRRGFSKEDIWRRICSQLPLGQKLKVADFVIDNDKTIDLTRRQVKQIWREIKNERN